MPHVNVHDFALMKTKAPGPPLHSDFLSRCLETTALAFSKR
jgi:hypothetical protein